MLEFNKKIWILTTLNTIKILYTIYLYYNINIKKITQFILKITLKIKLQQILNK